MLSNAHAARLNTYHTPKHKILGNPSVQPAPAWRPNAKAAPDPGSRILLSRLPVDVEENEVQNLFAKTVGPVKEILMVYNSQGRSRGMAVVTFARGADAAVARAKYNGKVVDGRRTIKIEILVDEDDARRALPPPPQGAPSLLQRLAPPNPTQSVPSATQLDAKQPVTQTRAAGASPPQRDNAKAKLRQKKGPRRLNKQRQQQQQPQQRKQQPKKKTAEELDREMEEYKARAESANIKVSNSMDVA